jgi:tellurite methyltransferase
MPLGLSPSQLREQFGDIDIYLFDQLLRGRIGADATVLDAGCGSGRNLVFLARAGLDLYGVDASADAIASARRQLAIAAPDFDPSRLSVQGVESLSFGDGSMDVVISSAVLHFAPGGMLFCRLASTIGIEADVRPINGRRHVLPDGSTRFLVDEALLMETTSRLGGTLLDPLKTTVVQHMRAMTTWVVGRS